MVLVLLQDFYYSRYDYDGGTTGDMTIIEVGMSFLLKYLYIS